MDNHMVIFFESSEHKQEDRLLCTAVNENLLGLYGFIEFAELRSQGWTALRFRIAQPGLLELLCGPFFQGQQFRNGHGFAVGGAEQIFGAEFVFCEETLELKGRKIHFYSPGPRRTLNCGLLHSAKRSCRFSIVHLASFVFKSSM